MKFSVAFLLAVLSLAHAASSSVGTIRNAKAISGLLKTARRLEDNAEEAEAEAEEEDEYLSHYQLKLLACKGGQVSMGQDGAYGNNYDVVVFRLCPIDAECDENVGCKEGYGDYVVGLNAYLDAYFASQEAEGEGEGGDFMPEEYYECKEFAGNEGGRKRKLEEEASWYIGATCTADGTSVKLELYTEDTCSSVSEETTFYDLAGYELPYSSGGLVPTGCTSCYGANENGEYEVTEYCMELVGNAYGCETNMEYYSDDGKDESQCEYIATLTYTETSSASAGSIVLWVFLALAIVGAIGFFVYMKSKKDKTVGGTVNDEGLLA